MSTLVRSAALALAIGVAALPGTSRATFGTRSGDHSGSSGSGGSGGGSSGGHEHKAVPVQSNGAHPVASGGPGYTPAPRPALSYYPGIWPYSYGWSPYWAPYYGYGYGYGYPAPVAAAPAPMEVSQQAPPPVSTFGFGLQAYRGGASVGLDLTIEGERWGFNGDLSAAYLQSSPASAPDVLKMMNAHLTFALLSGERGRLRLEGGVSGVAAPDLGVIGPDAGLSTSVHLIGPLAVEAAAHLTPLPHIKVDGSANAVVGLGFVGLKAGWKVVHLDDRGLLGDGSRNADTFSGPFVAVGMAF